MKLSALLLTFLGLAGCTASYAGPRTPWRVEVTTSGGFAGRGIGTYAIGSDRQATAVLMNGKECTWEVTDDDLRRVEELLAKARPRKWKDSYIPANRCCDRVHYTLTYEEAEEKTTTRWIDAPLPMPPDLVALANAIVGGEPGSVRIEAGERCK